VTGRFSLLRGFWCNRDFVAVPTGENDPMNEQIGYALIDAELRSLQLRIRTLSHGTSDPSPRVPCLHESIDGTTQTSEPQGA